MSDGNPSAPPRDFSLLQIGSYPLPRWIAPILGVAIGLAIGVRFPVESNWLRVTAIVAGVLFGLFTGMVVWTIDYIEAAADLNKAPRSWVTVLLLALTPLLCLIPFLGFLFVSYTFRRCKWLAVPDWWLAPFALTFVGAIASTLSVGISFLVW